MKNLKLLKYLLMIIIVVYEHEKNIKLKYIKLVR